MPLAFTQQDFLVWYNTSWDTGNYLIECTVHLNSSLSTCITTFQYCVYTSVVPKVHTYSPVVFSNLGSERRIHGAADAGLSAVTRVLEEGHEYCPVQVFHHGEV